MTRRAPRLAIVGFIAALGCTTQEPEDATSTAASSVGMSSGSSGDASSSSEGSSGSDTEASSSGSGGLVVDYETDVQPIWNGSCTCHLMGGSGTMTAPFLTLNPGMSIAELVGVPSEQSGGNRIEAGSTDDSYLWLKLTGAHDVVGEGDPMPPTGTLDEEQLEILRAWILAGAMP
ncbi:MAG: hypothetical protein KUG77_22510 [Nannocystaceae bacterium]|nr:hypothetical protein [Nannocystaceae bacterium]